MIKADHPNTVLVDGDEVRAVFGNDLRHTVEDRWRNAQRIGGLCDFLDRQGIHVVCAVLSIFYESQRWNREHLQNYFEVYIEAPFDQLVQRDPNGIYKGALKGDMTNVVGVDIDFPPPENPDLTVRNDGSLEDLLSNADHIVKVLPGLSV